MTKSKGANFLLHHDWHFFTALLLDSHKFYEETPSLNLRWAKGHQSHVRSWKARKPWKSSNLAVVFQLEKL